MYERVRGVALTREKFQFIFEYEHELKAILDKGVHTFNEWTLAIERWVEEPPDDYLQFIEVWVQIRNIPVNHYTPQVFTQLGELIGQVIEVAYDPLKPQINDFVRVKVKFDVSRPLRRYKVVNFKSGTAKILFDFERIQKRCFTCQRLTHEQGKCPIKLKADQDLKAAKSQKGKGVMKNPERVIPDLVLKESDILFGVVKENQVGFDPVTGRQRMAKEVIEDMRNYLRGVEGPEKCAREERIKESLKSFDNDPIGSKSVLRLEPAPVVSFDVNKEIGRVFGYLTDTSSGGFSKEKFVTEASCLVSGMSVEQSQFYTQSDGGDPNPYGSSLPFHNCSTAINAGLFGAGSSGIIMKKQKQRRRPYRARRKQSDGLGLEGSKGKGPEHMPKRKAADEAGTTSKVAKRKSEVAPKEGLSNF